METIIVTALTVLGPILAYIVKIYVDKISNKGKAELEKEKAKEDIGQFKEECLRAVKKVDLEYVLPLKEKGGFTPEAAKAAKELAIQAVKDHYGPERLVDLAMLFSVDAEGLMHLIGETIETAIINNRKAGSISLANEPAEMPEFLKIK